MRLRSIKKAAQEASVPEYRLRQWTKQGLIRSVAAGTRRYVDLDSLADQIETIMSGGDGTEASTGTGDHNGNSAHRGI